MALAAGLLGDAPLAAQTIIISFCSFTYSFPLGFGISTSTRVGNSLGSNLPRTAFLISKTALICIAILSLFNSTCLYIGSNFLGYLFSDDIKVVALVAQVLKLAVFFQMFDAIAAVGGGILRGCGRQKYGAWINLVGYYVVGLPMGLLLTFKYGYGLIGLWSGLTMSLSICAISIVCIIMFSTDWEMQAHRALKLVQQHENTPQESL